MIAENITLADLDPQHFANLIRLSRGEFGPPRERTKSQGPAARIVVIHKEGRCLKALHSQKGRLQNFDFPGLDKLEQIARREQVKTVIAIEHGAPRQLMHRIQAGLSLNENIVQQGFGIYAELRREFDSGRVKTWPVKNLKDVKYQAIVTIVKMILAAEELLIMCVYSDDGSIRDTSDLPLVTSGILRFNKSGECDLWATTDSLVAAGLKVGDWKKDYKEINRLSKEVWNSKVFAGFHLPLSAVVQLSRTHPMKQPKLLLEMEKSGTIVIDPFPMRLKMILKMGGMGLKK